MLSLSDSATRPPAAVATPDEIVALDERVTRAGLGSLSDQHRLAAINDQPGRQLAAARDGDHLVAVAQTVPGPDTTSLAVLVDPDRSDDAELAATVAHPVLGLATSPVQWWWSAPSQEQAERVRALGAVGERRLLQMRRPLPTGLTVDVETRPFVVGEDETTWLRVNNRAFATHPEQGHWDLDDLRQREQEAWFDPGGFRLHERDGRLAAFCWTKLHHDTDPVLGEIYVIGVDPAFQGLGLGRQLTLAGLAAIAERGVEIGMLYVDEENTAAVGLYRALGFEVHHVDVAFTFPVGRAP